MSSDDDSDDETSSDEESEEESEGTEGDEYGLDSDVQSSVSSSELPPLVTSSEGERAPRPSPQCDPDDSSSDGEEMAELPEDVDSECLETDSAEDADGEEIPELPEDDDGEEKPACKLKCIARFEEQDGLAQGLAACREQLGVPMQHGSRRQHRPCRSACCGRRRIQRCGASVS